MQSQTEDIMEQRSMHAHGCSYGVRGRIRHGHRGDVRIGEEVYVAPCVSLRADEANPIIIGDECNIQDGVIFHGLMGSFIELGKKISIAHGAVIHGPMKIGDESFVGFNSVVHA